MMNELLANFHTVCLVGMYSLPVSRLHPIVRTESKSIEGLPERWMEVDAVQVYALVCASAWSSRGRSSRYRRQTTANRQLNWKQFHNQSALSTSRAGAP